MRMSLGVFLSSVPRAPFPSFSWFPLGFWDFPGLTWVGFPVQNPPQIRPFCQEDFMKSLEHAGPQLTCVLKGDWLGLYR